MITPGGFLLERSSALLSGLNPKPYTTTVMNTRANVTGTIISAISVFISLNSPPKNPATVSATIPRGATPLTNSFSRYVSSVLIVDNNTEAGRTSKIMTRQNKSTSQAMTTLSISIVSDEVISMNTVDTLIMDRSSMK